MAMFHDYQAQFLQNIEQYFNEAKSQGYDLMVVYEASTHDRFNIVNSIFYIELKKGQEERKLTKLAERVEPNYLVSLNCVYDLSLPFNQAKKDITSLPGQAVLAFTTIANKAKSPHRANEANPLSRGFKKLRGLVLGS